MARSVFKDSVQNKGSIASRHAKISQAICLTQQSSEYQLWWQFQHASLKTQNYKPIPEVVKQFSTFMFLSQPAETATRCGSDHSEWHADWGRNPLKLWLAPAYCKGQSNSFGKLFAQPSQSYVTLDPCVKNFWYSTTQISKTESAAVHWNPQCQQTKTSKQIGPQLLCRPFCLVLIGQDIKCCYYGLMK